MSEKLRPNPLNSLFDTPPAAGSGPGDEGLCQLREHLGEISATADRILERVRSGDSQAFLERARQSGGQ